LQEGLMNSVARWIAFIDFEASSLSPSSYPIEVGWVFADGVCEEHLIAPHQDWLDWDPLSQQIHGISRSRLFRTGRPGPFVAKRISDALADCRVFSDAHTYDGFWLKRLFDAVGSSAPIEIEPIERLFAEMAKPLLIRARGEGIGEASPPVRRLLDQLGEALQAAKDAAEGTAPKRHRALADARHLREIWAAFGNNLEALRLTSYRTL
jgi:hypothetical protein